MICCFGICFIMSTFTLLKGAFASSQPQPSPSKPSSTPSSVLSSSVVMNRSYSWRERCEVLAAATHPRLGRNSHASVLSSSLLDRITCVGNPPVDFVAVGTYSGAVNVWANSNIKSKNRQRGTSTGAKGSNIAAKPQPQIVKTTRPVHFKDDEEEDREPTHSQHHLHSRLEVPEQGELSCLAVIRGDGDTIVGCGDFLALWSASTGKRLLLLDEPCGGLSASSSRIQRICSIDSDTRGSVVGGGTNKQLKIWDVAAPAGGNTAGWGINPVRSIDAAHGDTINAVRCFQNWLVCSGSADKTVRLWDTRTSSPCVRTFVGHEGAVLTVDVAGTVAASGGTDQQVRIWDVCSGQCIRTLSAHTGYVRAVRVMEETAYVASAGGDGTIRIWCSATGEHKFALAGHTGTVMCMQSVNGDQLYSGTITVLMWCNL